MTDLYRFLDEHHIQYQRHDHPPVFTVEDVHRLVPPLDAAKVKNLFFRDGPGKRHFLVIVEGDKRVDIKALAPVLNAKRLSFGSPERLKKHLGVEPGAVSLLALFNDREHAVEVAFDADLWKEEAFQFHPLVNTSTLVISREDIEHFLEKTGHAIRIIDVPGG
jgi:Ala-tRNA(Pro) deacylase